MSDLPYGPNTAAIRRFLVRFAGLGRADRAAIVSAYTAHSATRDWHAAEAALATAIERSGREPQRDALSGPLLQLVRRPDAAVPASASADDALATLDPIAEPALAALLALLVQDLLGAHQVTTLYAPFAETMPLAEQAP